MLYARYITEAWASVWTIKKNGIVDFQGLFTRNGGWSLKELGRSPELDNNKNPRGRVGAESGADKDMSFQ
jgi:hypothetical protein